MAVAVGYIIGGMVLGAAVFAIFIYAAASSDPRRRRIAKWIGLLTWAAFQAVNAVTTARNRWLFAAVAAGTVGVVVIDALWDRRRRRRVPGQL